jgi:hypothetical protein
MPRPRPKTKADNGTETGRWLTNGPDAGIIVRALHEGILTPDDHLDITTRYGGLTAKWGSRRLKDNFRSILRNYDLWKNGGSRKYTVRFFPFLCKKILTNSKDYFSSAFLLENGLLKEGDDEAFADDEEVWNDGGGLDDDDNDNDKEEEQEPAKKTDSPTRANTTGAPDSKPAAKKKKGGAKKGGAKKIEKLLEELNITDEDEEMKIRMVSHTVRVAPYDNHTFIQGTRFLVYAETPSGVSPRSVMAVQGGRGRYQRNHNHC